MPHDVKTTKNEAMEIASCRLEVSYARGATQLAGTTYDRVGACTSSTATIGSARAGKAESSMSSPVDATEARETGIGREVVDPAGGVGTDGATEADVRDAIDVADNVAGVRAGRTEADAIVLVFECLLPRHVIADVELSTL